MSSHVTSLGSSLPSANLPIDSPAASHKVHSMGSSKCKSSINCCPCSAIASTAAALSRGANTVCTITPILFPHSERFPAVRRPSQAANSREPHAKRTYLPNRRQGTGSTARDLVFSSSHDAGKFKRCPSCFASRYSIAVAGCSFVIGRLSSATCPATFPPHPRLPQAWFTLPRRKTRAPQALPSHCESHCGPNDDLGCLAL